jgi:hypothetical protein
MRQVTSERKRNDLLLINLVPNRIGDMQNIRERNQGIERQQVNILDVPFSLP